MIEARGQVWIFPDNVDTDIIAPHGGVKTAFSALRPDFYKMVKPGDVIVGGRSFGYGSARGSASDNVRALGLGGIVAESLARTFLRNCMALGIPAIPCRGVQKAFKEGDKIYINVAKGIIKNETTGITLQTSPLPAEMLRIMEAGGYMNVLKQMFPEKLARKT